MSTQPSGQDGAAETQIERTRLAWRRTVLTATVVVALAARLAMESGPLVWRIAVGIGLAGVLLAVALAAQRRIRALTAMADEPERRDLRPEREPVVLAGLALVLAALAAVEVLLRS